MASKKYFLTLALLIVSAITFAQTTDWASYWNDSSKVPVKSMPQYNQFLSNEQPYPVKPRNQWELGIGAGKFFVIGDRAILQNSYDGGVAIEGTLRKSLGHVFSIRGGLLYGTTGIPGTSSNHAFVASHNFTWQGNLDLIASLNNLSFYKGNPKWNVYVFTGYSTVYERATNKNNAGWGPVIQGSSSNYINNPYNNAKHWTWFHGISAGAGVAHKLSNRVNLAIEQRFTIPILGDDYLDGNKLGNAGDLYSFTTARLNINLGNSAKRVQPLWWLNPLNYAYSELNAPKHMKMPKVVLPDADGDGVTDQFDLEPNTPAGCPVDSHGVSKDSDGDGVPDCRDKELLTPQKCFPVDKDGVGTCPEPACCTELREAIKNIKVAPEHSCTLTSLPSIQFKSGAKLSKDATKLLDAAAASIKANPDCKVKVVGHPAASKAAQQLAYDRVDAVIKYLVTKQGVAENRFIFSYDGGAGDANTIDLLSTTEDGPNTVPAPHPNLRSSH